MALVGATALRNDEGKVILMRYKGSPWAEVKLRQATSCWDCTTLLPVGAKAFRPIDNSGHRMRRICCSCVSVVPSQGT
jgi:hypothetical protein